MTPLSAMGWRPARREPLPVDRKTRRAWWIAGIGTLLAGGGLAGLAAVAGGRGRDGLRFFLLGALLSCSAAAFYAVVTGALDSVRGHHVGRGRVAAAVVLGLLAILLPAMLVSVGG